MDALTKRQNLSSAAKKVERAWLQATTYGLTHQVHDAGNLYCPLKSLRWDLPLALGAQTLLGAPAMLLT